MADPHGLINFHKPTGITSAKALYAVRKVVGQRKSGHAGTLDPGADGVLVLCLGRATKLTEQLMDQPKVYRTRLRLNVTSESFDSDRPLIKVPVPSPPTGARLREVISSFEGDLQQVPPAVSAIKIDGRPAYKLERLGKKVELKPRLVKIYWLHLHNYTWPELDLEVACSRGTYVRALARDLGEALGTGGCLTALTRQAVGPFVLSEAATMEDLQAASSPEDYLIPLDRARELLARRPIRIPERPENRGPQQ